MQYKITISLPCYGRPVETKRAIQSVIDQDINGWELLVVGDGCKGFGKLWPWIGEQATKQRGKGNSIFAVNLPFNSGNWGTDITNANIQNAKGEYFCFLANDDWFDKEHLRALLNAIDCGYCYGTGDYMVKNTFKPRRDSGSYDFIYTNSVLPDGTIRRSKLKHNHIGHSELCIRTSFLQSMPPHKPLYGQDWLLIKDMLKAGAKYHYSPTATYHVGHLPDPAQIRRYRMGGKSVEGWPWWKRVTGLFRREMFRKEGIKSAVKQH